MTQKSSATGAVDGSIAYRLGNFVVRWQQKPGNSGELQALEVEGLAKWALHPQTSNPMSQAIPLAHAGNLSRNIKARRPGAPKAPAIAKTFRYDGAQAWLGDQQTTMHYDPLGQPALLKVQTDPGRSWSWTAGGNCFWPTKLKASKRWLCRHGALPIAWIESGRVYHLAVDWRGAPVFAFDSTGKVHWKADLHPLLSEMKHGRCSGEKSQPVALAIGSLLTG